MDRNLMPLVYKRLENWWQRKRKIFTSVLLVKIDDVDAKKSYQQDSFKEKRGTPKTFPVLRPRNPAPEVEGPSTDTNARLSIFSSRSSGPSKDGGITTHSPRTDSRVKVNLTDGRGNRQYVIDFCWDKICTETDPSKNHKNLPTEMVCVPSKFDAFLPD